MKNYSSISSKLFLWIALTAFSAFLGISFSCVYHDQMVVERLICQQLFSKNAVQALATIFDPIAAAQHLHIVIIIGLTANIIIMAIAGIRKEKSFLFYLICLLGTAVFAIFLVYDTEIFAFYNHIVLFIYVLFIAELAGFTVLVK